MHPLHVNVNWAEEDDAAVALLQDLLRFDTSNPPGNEADCAAFCAERLQDAGAEPRLLAKVDGRPNVVARLRGDGSAAPLLLTAHLDVVGVEEDRWTHPPFAAEIHDGFVWGRGAVDMKHMAAMSLTVMRLLARADVALRRDVIFAGVADEEAGCGAGSAWLVDEHPDAVRAEYMLGEVGGFTLMVGDRAVYPVQVAEKGSCWMRVRARGTTGHGSVPRPDNAVVRLAEFVAKVGRTKLPVCWSEPVERFVRALAEARDPRAAAVLPRLLRSPAGSLVVDRLISDASMARTLDALLRNTAAPTVLRAGSKANVVPSEAVAEIDGRIAVGSSAEELLSQLRRLGGEDLEFELLESHPPVTSNPDTPLFRVIADVVAEHHPGAVAAPSVIPGFTDAAYFSRLGTTCYGFSPVVLDPADDVRFPDLFHADDERIPVEGFKAGLKMLADVVLRFCT